MQKAMKNNGLWKYKTTYKVLKNCNKKITDLYFFMLNILCINIMSDI